MKQALYLSGTINMTLATILFKTSFVYSFVLFIIGIINFIYAFKSTNEQYNSKTIILLFAIINLFLNPISGIITLIGSDKLSKEIVGIELKKQKKETNKLDNLLKLGVALVSLSGIIFATTNWHIISSITKIIILLISAIFFITLSIIIEKKLKIISSSKGYWLLGMLFLILTVLAILYFEIVPIKSESLGISLLSITTSLFSFLTYKKYNNKIYQNITYIGMIISLGMILLHFDISMTVVMIILSLFLIIINIVKLNDMSKYLTYASVIISIFGIQDVAFIEFIILTILSITNLIVVTRKENEIEGILSPILINIFIIKLLSQVDTKELVILTSLIIYSVLYLINIFKIENKTYSSLMNIITNIAFIVIVISSLDDNVLLLITTGSIVLTSLINYGLKHENIILPIKVAIFLLSIMYVINNYLNNITIKLILVFIYVILFTLYKLIKNKSIKLLMLIMYYIFFYVSLIINVNNIVIAVVNILTSLIVFFVITKEQSKNKTMVAYINILITLLFTITCTNLLNQTNIINYIVLLLIYTVLTLFTIKNQILKKINLFAIILPFMMIIQEQTECIEIMKISTNILGMYIILLINTYLLKQQKDKQLVSILISSILILRVIFFGSWIIGLYVGVVALILIIYGLIKKEYKGLYIEGFIVMIVNIVYQFKYLWRELPLWLYLLLSGLIIIGIVTYKELKEKDTTK